MEQVKEREEPVSNSDCCEEDTNTSGLGTGGEINTATNSQSTDMGVLVSDKVTYSVP